MVNNMNMIIEFNIFQDKIFPSVKTNLIFLQQFSKYNVKSKFIVEIIRKLLSFKEVIN